MYGFLAAKNSRDELKRNVLYRPDRDASYKLMRCVSENSKDDRHWLMSWNTQSKNSRNTGENPSNSSLLFGAETILCLEAKGCPIATHSFCMRASRPAMVLRVGSNIICVRELTTHVTSLPSVSNSRTDCLSRAMVLDARSATLKQDLQWQEREKANSSQLTRTI